MSELIHKLHTGAFIVTLSTPTSWLLRAKQHLACQTLTLASFQQVYIVTNVSTSESSGHRANVCYELMAQDSKEFLMWASSEIYQCHNEWL